MGERGQHLHGIHDYCASYCLFASGEKNVHDVLFVIEKEEF
jgi:hypothetical protein